MVLHEIFRVASRFPRYISCYITENRFSLGLCGEGKNYFLVSFPFLLLNKLRNTFRFRCAPIGDIMELGSYNNLAQLGKCQFFKSKNHSTLISISYVECRKGVTTTGYSKKAQPLRSLLNNPHLHC